MIYGLYLSATGVLTNSYRQDVISNNLANSETVGFKKNVALFEQRLTESQERRNPLDANSLLDNIGGGLLCAPTLVDTTQGELETTGNKLDVAITGDGYFAVQGPSNSVRLTRNGSFSLDRQGNLILAVTGNKVLDQDRKPIVLDPTQRESIQVGSEGELTVAGKPIAKLGLFSVANPHELKKEGDTLMSVANTNKIAPSKATVVGGALERSNVDPAIELSVLMDAQRQLEANANMIKYQDSTLQKLVNEVGKIG
ncbi:MAG TPA: flagellar hook-basal body protein [Tepidisphaeraceae bacterium]|jgi:flagellar basal-body rod protein FlgG|nr:flagellar hook-basal body protein [Tepidisphaeraceae bacterium]